MKICEHCFSDEAIKGMIISLDHKDQCDFCKSQNCFVYDTDRDDALAPYFDEIFSAYSPVAELDSKFPVSKTASLAEKLKKDWHLFNPALSVNDIDKVIRLIDPEGYGDLHSLFDGKVGVAAFRNSEFLQTHSILKDSKWEVFVDKIKTKIRFHIHDFNEERLEYYCRFLLQNYEKGNLFYRARIKKDGQKEPYPPKKMGAPPSTSASNGRINPRGVSCLYLCEDKDTPFYETRAQHHDYISLAEFRLKKDIAVANLSRIDKINPVTLDLSEGIASDYLINKSLLEKINRAMIRPQRSGDSELEYLPTQYIADFIKSLVNEDTQDPVFQGIAFESAAHPGFYNLAAFYEEDFEIDWVKSYEVKDLNYKCSEI